MCSPRTGGASCRPDGSADLRRAGLGVRICQSYRAPAFYLHQILPEFLPAVIDRDLFFQRLSHYCAPDITQGAWSMSKSNAQTGLSVDQQDRQGAGPMLEPEVRVVGISRRIWAILAIMGLLAVAFAFAYFRTQGALDSARAALKEAQEKVKVTEIALDLANDAKEQAIADREQLVKELAAQGDKLAEFSRGEEQAKSEAVQASSGVEAAQRRIASLRSKLKAAEKANTALKAELEVLRAELEQARADVELWRERAEPYGQSTPPTGQNR